MEKKSARFAMTDATARRAKELLLEGVSQATIARMLCVSTETIGRMARGTTYRHVRVEGEEALRPEVKYVPRDALQPGEIPVWDRAEDAEKKFLKMMEDKKAKEAPIIVPNAVPAVKDTSPLTETELQVLGYFGRAAPGELVERARINGQLKGE